MSGRLKGRKIRWKTGGSLPGVAEKIRQAHLKPELREAARRRGLAQAADPEWRKRCGSPGAKNPNWQDGRSTLPYARGWTRKAKALAWERAKGLCEHCGQPGRDTHHKDFQKDNHDLENLQVLCRRCHKKLHAEHHRRNKCLHNL